MYNYDPADESDSGSKHDRKSTSWWSAPSVSVGDEVANKIRPGSNASSVSSSIINARDLNLSADFLY